MRIPEPDHGWASRSLTEALRCGSVIGVGGWQLVLAAFAFAPGSSGSPWPLVAMHLGFLAFSIAVLWLRWPLIIFFAGLYAVVVVDLATVDEVNGALCFVAVWTVNVTMATPVLVLPMRSAVPFCLGAALVVSGATVLLQPEWNAEVAASILVTVAVMIVVGVGMIRTMQGFAAGVDSEAAAAEREHHRLLATRRASREIAEDARVLHDTVINTLAAVANGGAAVRDPVLVRERCAREVVIVEALLAGRRRQQSDLRSVTADGGVEVRWSGMDPVELERQQARLPARVAEALGGAVQELVRNVAKHSGADRVDIDVRQSEGDLVVTVSDRGVGFVPETPAGRGLSESVLARAGEAGIDVEISSIIGAGTTVTLRCGAESAGAGARAGTAASPTVLAGSAESIRRLMCWCWAVAVTGAALASGILNRSTAWPTYAALVLSTLLVLAAYLTTRGGGRLSGRLTSLLVVAVPVCFWLGFAGTDFGHQRAYLWQGISLTPMLVVLLVLARSWRAVAMALALLLLTAGTIAVATARDDGVVATLVLAGAAPQAGQFIAWMVFSVALGMIAERQARVQQAAAAKRFEREAHQAVDAARERWSTAGVRACLDLLRPLALGELRAEDPQVRARCAEEERYLRQLLLLNPESWRLNGWLATALGEARNRGVRLTLRLGETDAPDEASSERFARIVRAVVTTVEPGSSVTVGAFPGQQGVRLLVVGPPGFANEVDLSQQDPWRVVHRRLGAQEVIEVTREGTAALVLGPSVGV